MSAESQRVTVTTASSEVVSIGSQSLVVWIRNPGFTPIELGGEEIESGEGYVLGSGESLGPLKVPPGNAIFGISTGTQIIHVLTVGR